MEQEEVEVERSIGVMEDSDELESLETRSHLSRRMADGREQDGLRLLSSLPLESCIHQVSVDGGVNIVRGGASE